MTLKSEITPKLRAILIDPVEKTITEVETTGEYQELLSILDIQIIDIVRLNATESLWVNDEGLLKDPEDQTFFMLKHYPQPIEGRGLILGNDEEGENVSTTVSLDTARKIISFPDKPIMCDYVTTEVAENVRVPGMGDTPFTQISNVPHFRVKGDK